MPTSDIKKGPLYVDSTNNRVGIGTTSPATALDVTGTVTADGLTVDGDAALQTFDGPILNLKSTDNTLVANDVVGSITFETSDSSSAGVAAKIEALGENPVGGVGLNFYSGFGGSPVKRMTLDRNGDLIKVGGVIKGERGTAAAPAYTFSDDTDTGMFNISNADLGFAVGGTERLRIDSNGNVAINGSVRDSSRFTINGNVSNPNLQSWQNTTSLVSHFWFRNPNGIVGAIITNGSSTAYNTSSDYRLKENVTDITDATTRLKQLNPVRFNFIANPDTTVDGFLAHEVQDVVPEAISGTHDEVDDDGNPVYQGIDQSKLTPLLTKALIEAVEKIEQLEARIVALEAN